MLENLADAPSHCRICEGRRRNENATASAFSTIVACAPPVLSKNSWLLSWVPG